MFNLALTSILVSQVHFPKMFMAAHRITPASSGSRSATVNCKKCLNHYRRYLQPIDSENILIIVKIIFSSMGMYLLKKHSHQIFKL
jgi:hypothetical protein